MAKILVVDDDEQVRMMLKKLLERDSHDVVTAENGVVAMQRQQENPADIVIVDIIMPEKEGFETIMELRREFPAVKIIAMSGGGQLGPEKYLKLAKVLGVEFALEKPLHIEELRSSVSRLIPARAV
jgi:CheY-like chemotaxis protein